MCYYIAAILPARADLKRMIEIGRSCSIALKPFENASLQQQLSAGERAFLTTKGHCDCGTVLGSLRRERLLEAEQKAAMEEKIVKLRKSGWKDIKIERWIEQRSDSASRKQRMIKNHAEKQTPDATGWKTFISEAILLGRASGMGLLLHWYGGLLETEQIRISRPKPPVRLGLLRPELFLEYDEDVIQTFVSDP